ncbi:MAG: winged helix-turn-helix transcriptional regulator [Bacteroidetes bacterium]|nr:winged helix-turn-helix transcriptional regulator [Bacteroidota bacterium]
MVDKLKALAEPNRLEILRLISHEELPAGEIARHFNATRPAISQHLHVLLDAGLIEERREGTRRLYRLRAEGFDEVRSMLKEFWDVRLQALKQKVEQKQRTQRRRHGRK